MRPRTNSSVPGSATIPIVLRENEWHHGHMPLSKGCSEKSLKDNIKLLVEEGRSQQQAVAIAYKIQQKNCGVDLFLFGQIPTKILIRILGNGFVACYMTLSGYDIAMFGRDRRVGISSKRGSHIRGYKIHASPEELKQLLEELPGYRNRSLSVHMGRSKKVFQTFVPDLKRAMDPTREERIENLRDISEIVGKCAFKPIKLWIQPHSRKRAIQILDTTDSSGSFSARRMIWCVELCSTTQTSVS